MLCAPVTSLTDSATVVFPLLAVGSLVAMFVFQRRDAYGRAFAASCAFIAGLLTTMAAGIYPNILFKVSDVAVHAGDVVQEGDVLAVVDTVKA